MITLFGATGYTGHLVAQALDRAGLHFRIAGRSPARLEALAMELPGAPEWIVADATLPETLPALVQGTDVLVNCAGPFTDLGEPVLAQAAVSGVSYLDTTNELGYVRRVQSYDAAAGQSGATVVPACGFEVALADCAAAFLAGEGEESWDEVEVYYRLGGSGSSYGSRRSAVRSLATSWIGYRDGRWVGQMPGRRVRRVAIDGQERPVLSFPSSEIATVPTHLQLRRVTAWMTISRGAYYWAPLVIPAFSWLARGPVGWLVLRLISRTAPPPAEGLRSSAPFTIRVVIRGGGVGRALCIRGTGMYDLTAEIVVYAAEQLARPDRPRAGVLAPAAALEPQALLDNAAAEWGVTLERE